MQDNGCAYACALHKVQMKDSPCHTIDQVISVRGVTVTNVCTGIERHPIMYNYVISLNHEQVEINMCLTR